MASFSAPGAQSGPSEEFKRQLDALQALVKRTRDLVATQQQFEAQAHENGMVEEELNNVAEGPTACVYKLSARVLVRQDLADAKATVKSRLELIAKGAVRRKLRIGILGSTRGTSLVPVMEACANGTLHAEIVAVVSDRSSAPILDKGRSLGVTVTTKFLSAKGLSRDQYDAECTSVLVGAGVEYVLLVGYMRILSKGFTDYWAGRCINVHPSLLPKHSGGMDLAVSSQIRPTAPSSDLAHSNCCF